MLVQLAFDLSVGGAAFTDFFNRAFGQFAVGSAQQCSRSIHDGIQWLMK